MQGKKFIDVICYALLELRHKDAKVIKMILQEGAIQKMKLILRVFQCSVDCGMTIFTNIISFKPGANKAAIFM